MGKVCNLFWSSEINHCLLHQWQINGTASANKNTLTRCNHPFFFWSNSPRQVPGGRSRKIRTSGDGELSSSGNALVTCCARSRACLCVFGINELPYRPLFDPAIPLLPYAPEAEKRKRCSLLRCRSILLFCRRKTATVRVQNWHPHGAGLRCIDFPSLFCSR